MTTGAPTGASSQSTGRAMIGTANDNPGGGLLLEMAFETQIGVARDQHLVVDGAVRVMTGRAAFAHRFMFEHKWPALRGVALAAGVMLGQQSRPAATDGRTFVGIVTIAAAHFPIQHRVAVGQLKLAFLVQVTLKTDVGRPFGIENGVMGAAALIVNAAGAVTRFAADFLGMGALGFEARMSRGLEIAHDLGMTLGATLRADIFGAGNLRRRDDGAGQG